MTPSSKTASKEDMEAKLETKHVVDTKDSLPSQSLDTIEDTQPGYFTWLVSITIGVSGFLFGLGVGSAAMIIPLYIAEVSPAKYRGRMIGIDNMSITGGQLIAYGVGASSLIPPMDGDTCEEATKVVAKVFPRGSDLQFQQKVQRMTIDVDEALVLSGEGEFWRQMKQMYTVPANLRALVAACGLMGMQQFTGYNTLMYYSSTLFGIVGFTNPIAVGKIIAGTGLGCTFIYFLLIDRFGRRFILLATMWGMAAFLVIAAIGFHSIPTLPDLTLETTNIGWPAYLVLASMIIFVVFYSLGIGNLAWVSSEFFPIEIRTLGTLMMTCTCWGTNIIVASTFLTQMDNTTPSGAFGFYAALCFIGWTGVYFVYPEVKGMNLEDIREVFNHGFGVEYARSVQKELERKAKAQARGETRGADP
ncbi:general substrate transporter [Penicillium angulare]|uniref:general substrate transporter n=1 Tax=Penicillium angulare TaxID=116970 RepID=UPI0025424964|nr:general substrate transporter [Penicillium angulare]KAJ5261320.1 general substrate transporter [Penicillium angulare]